MLIRKAHLLYALMFSILLLLCGCQQKQQPTVDTSVSEEENKEESIMTLKMTINEKPVDVVWESNDAVTALQELAKETLEIKLNQYGGFEQVGSIGSSLPRNDKQITTDPGDIVLYSGDQMVVFFGTNSWAYTRLGKIKGQSEKELTKLLKKKSVTITLKYE
ncbi:MAG: hypothetical protein J6P61_10200 [Erysipelotrichaceae bacterium]|nr:hypothetical protein [Erysipelotrichaceae bacterium]